MTSCVPPFNASAPSSSSLRNIQYMKEKWPFSETVASPCATPASASSSPLPPYTVVALPADQYGNNSNVMNSSLISPSSRSRLLPQLAGLPADALQLNPSPTPTLYPQQYQQQQQRRQDVVPYSINTSSPSDHPDQFTRHGPTRSAPLQSYSNSYPTENVSINSSYHRPRTSHPVFHSTSALAAHHGIPQSLPPVPRTSRFVPASSSAPHPAPAPPVASSSTPDLDFPSLCSNYLTMLSQNEVPQSASEQTNIMHDVSSDPDAVQAIMEVIQASPEFRMAQDFNEFLTSPMEDSPFEDFLTTPALESGDMSADMLTSPAIFDVDSFPDMGDAALFGGDGLGLSGTGHLKPSSVQTSYVPHPSFNFDDMYTMPSPTTPALDSASLQPSPRSLPVPIPSTLARRPRKSLPTGTRKNITPDALIPLEAPIQQRKYVTPSSTSRKEVPTAWVKKRARSQAFGEEDELEDELALGQGDVDAIEAKRRQNTLAARRSRKRKLEYQRELEISVEREKDEKEMWKHRAMLCKALLESHGHEVPSFGST